MRNPTNINKLQYHPAIAHITAMSKPKMNVTAVIEWVATVVLVVGALLTALRIDPLNIYFLNAGAALFLIWAVRVKRTSLIVVNAVLLIVYVYGALFVHV